jgi:hypothetical protein
MIIRAAQVPLVPNLASGRCRGAPRVATAFFRLVSALSRYSYPPLTPNPVLNPVRVPLWTLRDKAAQRRLALR